MKRTIVLFAVLSAATALCSAQGPCSAEKRALLEGYLTPATGVPSVAQLRSLSDLADDQLSAIVQAAVDCAAPENFDAGTLLRSYGQELVALGAAVKLLDRAQQTRTALLQNCTPSPPHDVNSYRAPEPRTSQPQPSSDAVIDQLDRRSSAPQLQARPVYLPLFCPEETQRMVEYFADMPSQAATELAFSRLTDDSVEVLVRQAQACVTPSPDISAGDITPAMAGVMERYSKVVEAGLAERNRRLLGGKQNKH